MEAMLVIRLLLVDDYHAIRRLVRRSVERTSDICVVGEAADGESAILHASTLRPHVILMDCRMPGMGGIAATAHLRTTVPQSTVIIV